MPRTTARHPEPPTLTSAEVEAILAAAPEETLWRAEQARRRMVALEQQQRGLPVGPRRRALRKLINKEIDTLAGAFKRLMEGEFNLGGDGNAPGIVKAGRKGTKRAR